jgi:hypothetical protein
MVKKNKIIYSFIYFWFINDSVSRSEYLAWIDWMMMNIWLKRLWNKAAMMEFKIIAGILLEHLKKNMQNLSTFCVQEDCLAIVLVSKATSFFWTKLFAVNVQLFV